MLIGWPIGVRKQFLGALALPSGETASPPLFEDEALGLSKTIS